MPDSKGTPNRQLGLTKPGVAKRPTPQPTDLAGVRRIRDILSQLPESAKRQIVFQAGDVLVQEGATIAEDTPALLMVEGALEEQMTYFVPGQGYVVQTVNYVQEGQFAHVQALVPGYSNQPAFCSIVAARDGSALMIYPSGLRQLANLGVLLQGEFRKYAKMLENLRQQNILFGGLATKLEELRRNNPHVPSDPMRFVAALNDAYKRIDHLERELREEQAQDFLTQIKNLKEDLYESQFVLDATNQQLARAQVQIENQFGQIRSTGRELTLALQNNDALTKQVDVLQKEIQALKSSIRRREDDMASDFTRRFPHTFKVLETVAFRELTEETEIAREATGSAESRLNLMHRGLEMLCQDHPTITVSKKVMHLFVGEEPPDEPTESRRIPTGPIVDADEFDTLFLDMKVPPESIYVSQRDRPHTAPQAIVAHAPVTQAAQIEDSFSEEFDEEPSSTPTMIPAAPMPPPFQLDGVPFQPPIIQEALDDGPWIDDYEPSVTPTLISAVPKPPSFPEAETQTNKLQIIVPTPIKRSSPPVTPTEIEDDGEWFNSNPKQKK